MSGQEGAIAKSCANCRFSIAFHDGRRCFCEEFGDQVKSFTMKTGLCDYTLAFSKRVVADTDLCEHWTGRRGLFSQPRPPEKPGGEPSSSE